MSCLTIADLKRHLGHSLELATYRGDLKNCVYLECMDCYEIVLELSSNHIGHVTVGQETGARRGPKVKGGWVNELRSSNSKDGTD